MPCSTPRDRPRDRKLVVAGLLARADGAVLLTQRRADQALPNMWEFPGGKVERGEHPEAALARELREELDVDVTVGRIWDVMHHAYPEYEVVMLVYYCALAGADEPRCREVQALAWVTPDRLEDYNVLPADAPLVARLRSEPHVFDQFLK
jgi:8-oxo-dGTP diphosphatase